jgi:hypothetical protein
MRHKDVEHDLGVDKDIFMGVCGAEQARRETDAAAAHDKKWRRV